MLRRDRKGHVVAPTKSVMNSRRRIGTPPRRSDDASYRVALMRARKIAVKCQPMSALGQKRTCALQNVCLLYPQ